MPPSKAKGPAVRTRTFDEAFAELNLTPAERTALVWHLAQMRARKTVEALLPQPDYGTINEEVAAQMGFDPRDILRTPVTR